MLFFLSFTVHKISVYPSSSLYSWGIIYTVTLLMDNVSLAYDLISSAVYSFVQPVMPTTIKSRKHKVRIYRTNFKCRTFLISIICFVLKIFILLLLHLLHFTFPLFLPDLEWDLSKNQDNRAANDHTQKAFSEFFYCTILSLIL